VTPFPDRRQAGQSLAARLKEFGDRSDVLVLGLPRGGVPVAAEVAKALKAPLDVFLVRKLGVPGHEELAMGAIAEGGVKVLSRTLIRELSIPETMVETAAVRERVELDRRARAFRGAREAPEIAGRGVILIDDGLATGSTMEAAILALRGRVPARIVVAVPVAARETRDRLRPLVDDLVTLEMPEPFYAVGAWYADFSQTTDEEVVRLLAESGTTPHLGAGAV
jgi:putative phosphoribosyl transferase